MGVKLPFNYMKICSTSHKACRVLEKDLNRLISAEQKSAKKLEVRTLASFLKYVPLRSKSEPLRFVPSSNFFDTITENALIYIDEASMINSGTLKNLEKRCKGCKIVFIGDPLQLPPVKEKVSPAFNKVTKRHQLSKIIRQTKGNKILEVTEELRNAILHKTTPDISADGVDIIKCDDFQFESEIKQHFMSDHKLYSGDTSNLAILAWTNKSVNYYNNLVQGHLHPNVKHLPSDCTLIAEGPILGAVTLNSPDRLDSSVKTFKSNDSKEKFPYVIPSNLSTPIYNNGATIKVTGVKVLDTPIKFAVWAQGDSEKLKTALCSSLANTAGWLCKNSDGSYTLKIPGLLISSEDTPRNFIIPYMEHKNVFKELSKILAKHENFFTLTALTDMFGEVSLGAASTVHRSQGSTYSTVFIDTQDILKCKDNATRYRLLYVAISRAKSKVYVK
tara:strand:+ start:1 stop:1338 length:1338 start_codon:yes stop_codon:yes gene_type:complete